MVWYGIKLTSSKYHKIMIKQSSKRKKAMEELMAGSAKSSLIHSGAFSTTASTENGMSGYIIVAADHPAILSF